MAESGPPPTPISTAALSTTLEEEFVSPLTAVRGALELLRDHPDLEPEERARFLESALRECARLESGVKHLADRVYGAPEEKGEPAPAPVDPAQRAFAARIRLMPEQNVVDLDFSDYIFKDSKQVNDFYDFIEGAVEPTGVKWHYLVNFRNCRVWPEAWIAFAHRGKRLAVNFGHDTVRYAAPAETEAGIAHHDDEANHYPSREEALAHVAAARAAAEKGGRR